MRYREFVEALQGELESRLGEAAVTFQKVTKNNEVTKDCFLISESGYDISPAVYIEEYYREFRDGMSLKEAADKIAEVYKECRSGLSLDAGSFCEFEKVRSSVFCRLINRGKNRKLLQNVPYVPYLDLAVVFYYAQENKTIGSGTVLIHSEHMQFWNITEQTLWNQARENTRRCTPAKLYTMKDLLLEMVPEGENMDLRNEDVPMHVLTNEKRYQGACGILYDPVLQEAAQKLGSFYVLPSSVHECILVPENASPQPEELMAMVHEINLTQVPPEEVLSDHIYHYDAKKHHLTIYCPH